MISLEQIRLLEGKITRAIELIRVLKEENATLRKGLDSAQRRMKELEELVEGFKSDQKEIESVIVRTLKNLDELEETDSAGRASSHAPPASKKSDRPQPSNAPAASAQPAGLAGASAAVGRAGGAQSADQNDPLISSSTGSDQNPAKGELDIF